MDVTLSKSTKGLDPNQYSTVSFRPAAGTTINGHKGGGSSVGTMKGKLGKKGISVNMANSRLTKKPTKTPLLKGSNLLAGVTSNVRLRDSW